MSPAPAKRIRRKRKIIQPSIEEETKFSLDILPDDLLLEILIRLPSGKYAVQCKGVCKRWLSLISHPLSIRRFLGRPHRPGEGCFGFILSGPTRLDSGFRSPLFSWLDHQYFGSREISLDFLQQFIHPLPKTSRGFRWMDAYNCSLDLVLFVKEAWRPCVANLTTSEWLELPRPWRAYRYYLSMGGLICKFCEERGKRIFEVLFVVDNAKVIIYSSETGKWTTLVSSIPIRALPYGIEAHTVFACNGKLHWRIDGQVIVVDLFLDFANSNQVLKGYAIRFPPVRCANPMYTVLGVSQRGRLRLFETYEAIWRVWELCDYSTGDWALQYSLDVHTLPSNRLLFGPGGYFVRPLGLHPYSTDLAYLLSSNQIVLFNMKTTTFQRVHAFHSPDFINAMMTRFSQMIIPWWPTPISAGP